MKRVVVAYSGGLDTSIMVRWLKERYKELKVICFWGDLGQGDDSQQIEQRAYKAGADKVIKKDLKKEFIKDYVFKALRAGVVYEGGYLLSTALSRPLLAKALVEVAVCESADAVAHGATAKGNDQIRFEFSISVLAPHIKILAPAKEWEFKSRKEQVEYAKNKNIPIQVEKDKPYSIDKNLWGVSIECGPIEDIKAQIPEDAFLETTSPIDAPKESLSIEINIDKGIPIAIDSEKMDGVSLVKELNQIGKKHAIGRVCMIEDRVIGLKSREVYEFPSACILYKAFEALNSLVFNRETLAMRNILSQKYAQLIYDGLWFTDLREAIDAFFESLSKYQTGKVRLKLYKGNIWVESIDSPFSLYKEKWISYEGGHKIDKKWAEGLVEFLKFQYLRGRELP